MKLMSVRNRQAKVHVIANQVAAKPDVTVKEFEAGMEAKLRCVFPHDPKVMTQADAEGPAARRPATPKHKIVGRPAPALHRARRRARGGEGAAAASSGGGQRK